MIYIVLIEYSITEYTSLIIPQIGLFSIIYASKHKFKVDRILQIWSLLITLVLLKLIENGMFETLPGSKSLFRVFLKHFFQKIVPSLLELAMFLLFFKVKVHLYIVFHYFFGTFARE
jgi:hypothetical protein